MLIRPAPARSLLAGVPVLARTEYTLPVAPAVRRFKYGGRSDFARPLARLLAPALRGLDVEPVDLVVPVPLHPKRLAERGYNQAALLANFVADDLRARYVPLALVRQRHTPHQASLPRAQRLANVQGAIRVRKPSALTGRSVVLVDDVVTTGATAIGCLRALLEAGAEPRAVLTIARVTRAGDDGA
jgi:ComF family protein